MLYMSSITLCVALQCLRLSRVPHVAYLTCVGLPYFYCFIFLMWSYRIIYFHWCVCAITCTRGHLKLVYNTQIFLCKFILCHPVIDECIEHACCHVYPYNNNRVSTGAVPCILLPVVMNLLMRCDVILNDKLYTGLVYIYMICK